MAEKKAMENPPKKDESGKKDVSYEENVISSEEFSNLEKKEGKKIKLKPTEDTKPGRKAKDATDVDMLLLKTEKIEGKLESIGEGRKALEERISGINQEIGELRSSLMEKDRQVREFSQGFVKIKEMAEGMEPEKLQQQFAAAEEATDKNLAAIESMKAHVDAIKADVRTNKGVLGKIRDIENLMGIIASLREKVAKVEDDRKFTSRTSGKIETMFSDLSGKLAEFQSYKDKIAFNEETMHEIMKTVDLIETKMQETAKKDDLKKLEGRLEEELSKTDTKIDDKMYEMRKLLDDLLSEMKKAGLKGVLEMAGKSKLDSMFVTKNELKDVSDKLDKLREDASEMAREKQRELNAEVGKRLPRVEHDETEEPSTIAPLPEDEFPRVEPIMGVKDQIDAMIGQADEAIKTGNLDIAKNLYREALSMYNQINQADTPEEAAEVYERIRKLYSRLRIYS